MHILVVDDEMVSRIKMETLMQTFGKCSAAENGQQAIECYQSALNEGAAYEVVMLDIDMPDMQGTEVLKKIREMEHQGPHRAAVLMVTAQSGQEQVVSCIQGGCDDYIAKPFNISIIRNKLLKLGVLGKKSDTGEQSSETAPKGAEAIFKEINNALRSGELTLPAMPQIGIKFREMVQQNKELDELADLLKQDVFIASKLIRLANSALYRGYEKSRSLEHAISRLGMAETEQIVTAIANKKLFMVKEKKYVDMIQEVWLHSLATAYGAEILSQSLARSMDIDPFSAGLFHDIGALALIQIVAELENRGRYADAPETEDLCETVMSNHALFGAKLMEKWEFSDEYIRIALCHSNLHAAESITDGLLIVHFANLVAKDLGYTTFGQIGEFDLIDAPSAQQLKLAGPQIAVLKHNVQSKMAKASEMGK